MQSNNKEIPIGTIGSVIEAFEVKSQLRKVNDLSFSPPPKARMLYTIVGRKVKAVVYNKTW